MTSWIKLKKHNLHKKGRLRSPFFCGGGIALNTWMPAYLKDFDDNKGNYGLLWEFVNNKSLRTVIDVGAWWGPWSLWWCEHAERVEIFEPNPEMKQNSNTISQIIQTVICTKWHLGE